MEGLDVSLVTAVAARRRAEDMSWCFAAALAAFAVVLAMLVVAA